MFLTVNLKSGQKKRVLNSLETMTYFHFDETYLKFFFLPLNVRLREIRVTKKHDKCFWLKRRRSECKAKNSSFFVLLRLPLSEVTFPSITSKPSAQRAASEGHQKPWMPPTDTSASSSQRVPKSNFTNSTSFSIHTNFLSFWHFPPFSRVSYERDTKIINAASFTIEREEHTIGNILRMYDPFQKFYITAWNLCKWS